MDEFGKDAPVRELTAERVKAFFESERGDRDAIGEDEEPVVDRQDPTRTGAGDRVGRGEQDGQSEDQLPPHDRRRIVRSPDHPPMQPSSRTLARRRRASF
jgi:hypothetical protein